MRPTPIPTLTSGVLPPRFVCGWTPSDVQFAGMIPRCGYVGRPDNFYFLFLCNYEELWVRPSEPVFDRPTAELWKWDVAEVFIGTGQHPLTQYCEFELSPRGEWLDFRIDCTSGGGIAATPLDSKMVVAASQNQQKNMWCGFLRVPCGAVFSGQAEAGQRLRINFFRSQGTKPTEITWRPGYSESFHVPAAFGELLLIE